MAVLRGIAMPWKMLGCDQHRVVSVRVSAGDEGVDETRDFGGIFSIGADIDNRVVGIVIDISDRREQPVHAQSARFPSRLGAFVLHSVQVLGGGERHAVGPSGGGSDTHGRASLKISTN